MERVRFGYAAFTWTPRNQPSRLQSLGQDGRKIHKIRHFIFHNKNRIETAAVSVALVSETEDEVAGFFRQIRGLDENYRIRIGFVNRLWIVD